jgi:hypothetical protein
MHKLQWIVAGGVSALLALGGCGGSDSPDVASLGGDGQPADTTGQSNDENGAASEQAFEDAMLEFAQCMREHGVDMPDPSSNDGGMVIVGPGPGAAVDDETFQTAQEACQPILDEVEQNLPQPDPEEMARMRDQALAFAQCMREKGFDMPDPTFDEGGGMALSIGTEDGGEAGPSQEFLDASEECAEQTGGPTFEHSESGGGTDG